MTGRRAAVAAGSVAVVAATAVSVWLRRIGRQRPVTSHTGPQRVRRGWCSVCGIEVRGDDLHEVVDAGVDNDGALTVSDTAGGGTAMAAEYCPDHCPGTCRRPHRPVAAPAPTAPAPWRRHA